jgi:hypothetical protein
MIDQILAWDNELFGEDLGPLPEVLQDDVRRALLEFLDLLNAQRSLVITYLATFPCRRSVSRSTSTI